MSYCETWANPFSYNSIYDLIHPACLQKPSVACCLTCLPNVFCFWHSLRTQIFMLKSVYLYYLWHVSGLTCQIYSSLYFHNITTVGSDQAASVCKLCHTVAFQTRVVNFPEILIFPEISGKIGIHFRKSGNFRTQNPIPDHDVITNMLFDK